MDKDLNKWPAQAVEISNFVNDKNARIGVENGEKKQFSSQFKDNLAWFLKVRSSEFFLFDVFPTFSSNFAKLRMLDVLFISQKKNKKIIWKKIWSRNF